MASILGAAVLNRDVEDRNGHRVDHGIVDRLGAGDRNQGAFGMVRFSLLSLRSAEEFVGVDGRPRQSPDTAQVRTVPRPACVAAFGTVELCGGISELLEGIASITEVQTAFVKRSSYQAWLNLIVDRPSLH